MTDILYVCTPDDAVVLFLWHLFWILMQVPIYVGCVGRSTSIITAFRRTSEHTEVRHLSFFLRTYLVFLKSQIITDWLLCFSSLDSMVLKWFTSSRWVMHALFWPGIVLINFFIFYFGLWRVLTWSTSRCEHTFHLFPDFSKADYFFPYRIREHDWRWFTPDTQQWVHFCTLMQWTHSSLLASCLFHTGSFNRHYV